MKLYKKMLTAIALTAIALSLLMLENASAKMLVYCSEASPEGFDPAPYTSSTTFDASSMPIYNRLVEFENGTTKIIPGLAESWDVSQDGLEYTFHLRKSVKFQTTDYFTPTRELNVDDVLFTFNRQRQKADPWHEYTAGIAYQYFESMDMQNLIKDIVKIDDLTVKFVLNHPEAPFIANMAMSFASIVSKEYADKLNIMGKRENFNQMPVGTGPFTFVAYQKDAVIRYKANPDYWRGKQPIDDLIFAITPDAAVRMQKLKANECQITVFPTPADIEGLKANPNLKVEEQAGLNIAYLAYNTLMPPFDKVAVRKALNMAINKQAIIDAVFQGSGQIAKNPIPPTLWSYNDALIGDSYDPESAKKMLESANVKNLKMKVWAMPVGRAYMPNARRTAELIQSDFAKIGVKVDIISMEWGEYIKKSSDKNRDGAVLFGWTGDNGDPDNFLGVTLSCAGVGNNNRAQWCYKPFDDLIQKAKMISNQGERTKLYKQAQVIFQEQAPWAALAHSTVFMPMSKKVTGFKIDPLGAHRFDGVDITD